ncbi:neuferricin [Trichonephila inaurata madagascariensis]|uniref:Neuferricin n=1 Tax=Trichonephila inaurata madagascariensis TaxID=2747483 RepID=A0A8X6IB56_9ARAC|nr:neuferricin [Trichonephila inaurata madagascariensis]
MIGVRIVIGIENIKINMGSSAVTAITVGLCLVLVAVYFASDSCRVMQNVLIITGLSENFYVKSALNFLKPDETDQGSSIAGNDLNKSEKNNQLLLSPEELKSYDGGPDSKGLYLAILGEIFDVEKGAQHYRPGGGYAFFAGRDATRAYITGDFSEAGLIDDVSDLDSASLISIEDWLSFYKEEYKLVDCSNSLGGYSLVLLLSIYFSGMHFMWRSIEKKKPGAQLIRIGITEIVEELL